MSYINQSAIPLGGCLDNFDSLDSDSSRVFFSGLLENPPTLAEALRDARIPRCMEHLENFRTGEGKMREFQIKARGLSDDEADAISCYTFEVDGNEESPYALINTGIATSRNRENINRIGKFIFLLLSGLRKLPPYKVSQGQSLFRGIRARVPLNIEEAKGHQYYANGTTVTWWAFTSTSINQDVVSRFIGNESGTMFIIGGENLWGYNIKDFSATKKEYEVVLEPEAIIRVDEVLGGGKVRVINVTLQPFKKLVLEDIIDKYHEQTKIQKMFCVQNSKYKRIKVSWPLLENENSTYKRIKVSWPLLENENDILCHVNTKNTSLSSQIEQDHETSKNECTIERPDVGGEYEVSVSVRKRNGNGNYLCKSLRKRVKIEPLNIKMAIETLNSCVDNAEICVEVLRGMKELMTDGQSSENSTSIIEAIVRVMNEHIDKPDICEQGCKALDNIKIENTDENGIEERMTGAIKVVLKAIKEHRSNANVCKQGFKTLKNIALKGITRDEAGKADAFEAIVGAMNEHIDKPDICEQGCWVLINTTLNAESQVNAGEKNAIEAIVKAMKTHMNNANVCENGCFALRNIATHEDNQRKAGEAGAIEVILNAMEIHINNAKVCEYGCEALWNITLDDDNQRKLKEANKPELIKSINEKHTCLSKIVKSIF